MDLPSSLAECLEGEQGVSRSDIMEEGKILPWEVRAMKLQRKRILIRVRTKVDWNIL